MVKAVMCWKCHKYIAEGEPFCRYCGASVASPDAKYHTDGRTVDTKDEREYLSAPPPKYKKKRNIPMILGGTVIVVVVLFLLLAAYGSTIPDARYVCTVETVENPESYVAYVDPDCQYVKLKAYIVNDYAQAISNSPLEWQFELILNGNAYGMLSDTFNLPDSDIYLIPKEKYGVTVELFKIPKYYSLSMVEISLDYQGDCLVEYDPNIPVWA